MGDKNKYNIWGSSLSLSLKPSNTNTNINIDDKRIICKREPNFSKDEKSPKMHKPNNNNNNNNKLMTMPKIMEMDIKEALEIDLEEVEIRKDGSLNSSLSSSANGKGLGGFRGDRDIVSDDEGGSGWDRKKLRLSKEQISVLERSFKDHTTLNTTQKLPLATQVNLKPRQVEVWFQNRRARTKLKQTEVECDYLRRFCETLTEQNRNLQKEVHELRALKGVSSDQSGVHGKNNHPSTTLNLCPSCKSVSATPSVATTSKSPPSGTECYQPQAGVLHRPVLLNLKKLSLSINNNRMIESHLTRS